MCNLAQDVHLEEGVYAYIDIETALSKLDRTSPSDRTKCIGIVEGYLKFRHEDKVSLNPRSTKLIAVFSPWDADSLALHARCGRCAGFPSTTPPVGGTNKVVSTVFQS